MYNMDIAIFGYKINMEILILIGVVYLILVAHTCVGCSNYGMMEGFDGSGNLATDFSGNSIANMKKASLQKKEQAKQAKVNLKTQVVAGGSTTTDDTSSSTSTEGFTGLNANLGNSSPFDLTKNPSINTTSWSAPNMTVVQGQPLSAGVKQFLSRDPQTVPLPEGEMLMFAKTPFKPECCPNTYSTSSGCACATSEQFNWLQMRGGNNVPYSEY